MSQSAAIIQCKPTRIFLFDELRGFSILSMLLYHLFYDLVSVFGVSVSWYYALPGYIWQQSICIVFILISGACCYFSKNNLARGGKLLFWALCFSLVTILLLPEMRILFGLLHFMGCSVLLFSLVRQGLERIPPVFGCVLFFLLFWLCKHLPDGYLGLLIQTKGGLVSLCSLRLPDALYQTEFLFPLGFPSPGFFSSDYFPLLPYFLLFLSGSFLGRLGKEGRLPPLFYSSHSRWLAFLGRNSLWIYLFHQPVLFLGLSVLFHLL